METHRVPENFLIFPSWLSNLPPLGLATKVGRMGSYWSRYRVGLGVLTAVCVMALTAALGPWRRLESVEQGMRLVSKGEYVPAARTLAKAVALSPSDARAHYYLGLAYGGMGRGEAALSHLREAVRLDPSDARFHDGLGQAYRRTGDTEGALGELEEAVRRAPDTLRYEMDLAGLLLERGRVGEAVAHLRQMERAKPSSPDIRLLLADVLKQAGDRDGMENEYREVIRLADGTALGELARRDLRAAVVTEGHQP
jgi:Flp pilus assembly protein TadD